MFKKIRLALFDPKISGITWLAIAMGFACLAMVIDFSILGVRQKQGDTQSYLNAINFVETGEAADQESLLFMKVRLMKPLYPVVGSLLAPPLNPADSMLVLNIFFYLATVALMYLFLRSLKFQPHWSALGAAWLATGYPIYKYGLSLLTDMGGYFFIMLTIYLAVQGFEKRKLGWFAGAGLALGLGSLTKETGLFGMFFVFGALALKFFDLGWKLTFKAALISLAGFLLVFIPVQVILARVLDYNYFNFWTYATTRNDRNIIGFLGIYGGAFHLLWIYAAAGLYPCLKEKVDKYWIALWFIGVPMLFWNSYVTRYAFIWFPAIIPLALKGLQWILSLFKKYPTLRFACLIIFAVLPILISTGLILFIKNGSFFKALGFGVFPLHD